MAPHKSWCVFVAIAAAAGQAAMSALARTFCHGKLRSKWPERQNRTGKRICKMGLTAKKGPAVAIATVMVAAEIDALVFRPSVDAYEGGLLESKPDRLFLGWRTTSLCANSPPGVVR
jgi:hypothetical protein